MKLCDDFLQADALREDNKLKYSTPLQFENIKNVIGQGSVNTYDGFRLIVQKQLNLNTIVSHL